MAISTLEEKGIKKERIFAVPLDTPKDNPKFFDTIHRSDGISLIDIGVALSTAFSVIGASIGFKLSWGPIYWGLIGAFIGFVIGFVIRLCSEKIRNKKKRKLKGRQSEVILIVDCDEKMAELAENILLGHSPIGIAKIRKAKAPV